MLRRCVPGAASTRRLFAAAAVSCPAPTTIFSNTTTSSSRYTPVQLNSFCAKRFYVTPPTGGNDQGQAATFTYSRDKFATDAKPDLSEQQKGERMAENFSETATEDEKQTSNYNPWEVLGLKPGASLHDVRTQYHDLLKACHPNMVEDEADANVAKVNEINKAYETITKAPTLDKRFKGLISDSQYIYYKYLPEWMARNVDEMPRYWSWVRWRVGDMSFLWAVSASVCTIIGYYLRAYPEFVASAIAAFIIDCLFHTFLMPTVIIWYGMRLFAEGPEKTLAWLTSPRTFMQRNLMY